MRTTRAFTPRRCLNKFSVKARLQWSVDRRLAALAWTICARGTEHCPGNAGDIGRDRSNVHGTTLNRGTKLSPLRRRYFASGCSDAFVDAVADDELAARAAPQHGRADIELRAAAA